MTAHAGLTRDDILAAIREVAARHGSNQVGKQAFTAATGIPEYQWSRHWPRWSEAVAEAGIAASRMQPRFESEAVLRSVASLASRLGRMPTVADLRVEREANPAFPHKNTVANHFQTQQGLLTALHSLFASTEEFHHLRDVLPAPSSKPKAVRQKEDARKSGWVYLLKSGAHYKIGRSDEVERRVKTISIALPEAVTLVHAIRTDDPAGIEAYWHRRFADKRANGEWFRLERSDVSDFTRRTVQ